ncbi:class A beta-lactamase-related serine hydrolase [Halieaceae bacterium IMCC14734]|uniref:Class A beta-lactamase-related serine hydrolase n=1 Tax=Candidatus Litorirhabdus singularis TaxID=2518993 RepID=A0ABT3TDY7_9GAMM|nr:serine hydrolase [Candidatus Litorirhabdus singularis]MCX2980530.1 class A beta-lactamase-related serine hydrolase [Candidatus Litorirhabdus singularis]
MSPNENDTVSTHGSVASGFESVKQMFAKNMRTMAEAQAQLCVYHKGEKVIDLWAAPLPVEDFSADSIINVFSSGKSLETIAIAWLVGKGLLSYDATIASYWPEFAANGKSEVLVADLMRHESGLAGFNQSLEPAWLLPENIKQNQVGSVIEAQPQVFASSDTAAKREYHAMTRGWVANELFRRVDPTGRTMGEFLQEEISAPLQADAVIGVPEAELGGIAKVIPMGIWAYIRSSFRPKLFGRKVVHNIFQVIARIVRMIPVIRRGSLGGGPPPLKGMSSIGIFNEPAVEMGETPSANAHCSARGLAKIAAMMSAGGSFDGREYLSSTAWAALHDQPIRAAMGGFLDTSFTQGGLAYFAACGADSSAIQRDLNQGREGFYGWMGLGGSVFQWHPELDIGLAFVPTELHEMDFLNERAKAYQAEVLKCVQALPG